MYTKVQTHTRDVYNYGSVLCCLFILFVSYYQIPVSGQLRPLEVVTQIPAPGQLRPLGAVNQNPVRVSFCMSYTIKPGPGQLLYEL